MASTLQTANTGCFGRWARSGGLLLLFLGTGK